MKRGGIFARVLHMATRRKPMRVGQIWQIEFLDHVEDGSEPLSLVVYGRLSVVTRKHVCIDCWAYADPAVAYDSNCKRFTILRSTITRQVRLLEEE